MINGRLQAVADLLMPINILDCVNGENLGGLLNMPIEKSKAAINNAGKEIRK